MFNELWKKMDGKKLLSAVIGAIVFYGYPYCRAKWPWLPWDEVLIPLLGALGITGLGHRVVKAVPDEDLPPKLRTGTRGWNHLIGTGKAAKEEDEK